MLPAVAAARVVVADDSALMRRLVANALADCGFAVVGTACDGDEALRLCEREKPDVLTLDLSMPGTDGLAVLRRLRESKVDLRVVVVSAFSPAFGARAVDALADGAFDLVAKPGPGVALDRFLSDLRHKVGAAVRAGIGPCSREGRRRGGAALRPRRSASGDARTVVIASSTGGPRALAELIPKLPQSLGRGTLIVQHMPPGFTASLAARLDRASSLTVREAAGGERIEPSVVLVAPGGRHLRVNGSGTVHLSEEPEIQGLRPRADVTITDAARLYGERLLLVVLTGMGNDGLAGAREVKRCGGLVLVQAEGSCTVYGMPRAVVEANLADGVFDLDDLAEVIAAEAGT